MGLITWKLLKMLLSRAGSTIMMVSKISWISLQKKKLICRVAHANSNLVINASGNIMQTVIVIDIFLIVLDPVSSCGVFLIYSPWSP